MSKDKQIEEMALTDVDLLANDINQHCPDLAENYCGGTHCVACLANALTVKGYRKASEVAREIFERIDECVQLYLREVTYSLQDLLNDIYGIEKHYTEGEK